MGAARRRHHAAAGRHPPRGVGLRQVWKAPTSPYLKPGGGLRWRVWGGRQADAFATLSGHEEEGQSPEVQQRTKQVCHPGWGGDESPHAAQGIWEPGPAPPSAASGGPYFPGSLGFALFLQERGVWGGIGCPGEESGLWDIGGGHEAWEGVVHPRPRKERSSPPDNPRLFLAAQGIRG